MKPFHTLKSTVIALPHNDIDTDQIIPAQYLKVTDKQGLADGLFAGWRYYPSGEINPDFSLNIPVHEEAEILLAGDNFGCGSSREHAPWALTQWGFRAIISTSFADIFRNNALKNGLLPVEIASHVHRQLLETIKADPSCLVTIDLPSQTLSLPGGILTEFSIDPFSKKSLEEGVDTLGYLLKFSEQINTFERNHDLEGPGRVNTTRDQNPVPSTHASK